MHINYFSYLRSKVAAADALNHYAACSLPHQISGPLNAVMVAATCNCWTHLFYSEGVLSWI